MQGLFTPRQCNGVSCLGQLGSIKLDAVPDADVDATPDVDDTTADKDDATADVADDDATSDVDDADVEEATPDVDVEGGDETGVCGTGVTILCLMKGVSLVST